MADPKAIEALLQKQAIAERLHLYARGWDRMQRALILDTFHPDATIRQGDFSGPAHRLMNMWLDACATRKSITHLISNLLIELRKDVALSEAHFLAHHRRAATEEAPEHDWFIKGRYLDRFERREDGIWRVADRVVVLDFERIVEPADPDLAALPSEARGKFYPNDPLYALLDSL